MSNGSFRSVISVGGYNRVYPASVGQHIWALHFAERSGDEPLFSTLSLRLTGRMDVTALQRGLSAVVARHEALRTTLHLDHGQVLQVVSVGAQFKPAQIDLTSVAERDRERIAAELASRELPIQPGMDSHRLFQVRLIKLDTVDHVLTMTAAEAVCDGPSRDLFWGELQQFYETGLQGVRPLIEPLPVQYGDFAVWQSQQLQRPEVLKQRDHWLKQLTYATGEMPLIVKGPRPLRRSFAASQSAVNISEISRCALSAIAARRGATLFMGIVATICAWLKSQTGIDWITIGSTADGRNHRKFQGVIGLFATSFLFRVDLSGDPTFLDVVDEVRDAALETYQNQEFPLELAIKESEPSRNLYLQPPFAIKVVLQQGRSSGSGFPDLKVEKFGPNMAKARYDLTFSLLDLINGLTGTITYNSELFSAAGLKYLINSWYHLIDQVTRNPESKVRGLSDTATMLPLGC